MPCGPKSSAFLAHAAELSGSLRIDCWGLSGNQGLKTRKSFGDATMAVFHVNDDEVIACMACNFSQGGTEAKEEETVEGFFISFV